MKIESESHAESEDIQIRRDPTVICVIGSGELNEKYQEQDEVQMLAWHDGESKIRGHEKNFEKISIGPIRACELRTWPSPRQSHVTPRCI